MARTLVMKFGGAAVAKPESFAMIADIIAAQRPHYERLIVVVSAMGRTTDDLVQLAHRVHENPPKRELDMLLSVGERISMSLLAMALSAKNIPAISFTGSQSGIITTSDHNDAKIIDVRLHRIAHHFDKIVVIAGFQGVSQAGEITTLGRGGSDTTAVALAIALDAEGVDFYKDVPGVFNLNPKEHLDAVLFKELTYSQAYELTHKGAKILHNRCVKLAQNYGMPLRVRPFDDLKQTGTLIFEKQNLATKEKRYEQ